MANKISKCIKNIKITTYIFTSLIIGISNISHAETSYESNGLSKQFAKCMDKAEGANSVMIECISAENIKQNLRLSKAYKQALLALSDAQKKQLADIQKIWIKYREDNCNFYATLTGGRMDEVNSNECSMFTNANRAMELEGLNPQ
jgi:uncharacterized protein YecT (DUF1311 family)